MNQMPHVRHRARACNVMWLRGRARQVCVNVLECTLARDGACHFDAHLLKHTSCQIVAKTVKGFWTVLSEVMQCQASSYHDSTCAEVCPRCCVKVLRHSHLFIVPFCRTCGRTGLRVAPSWLYFHTAADVNSRNFSRTRML